MGGLWQLNATVEEMFAKEKPSNDPDYNPLLKKTDPISTGGKTEATNAPSADSTPTAAQSGGQTESTAVKESAAAEAGHPSSHAAGHQPAAGSDSPATQIEQASATPAPDDAGASSSIPQDSPQPDLLSGNPPAGSNGLPHPARQASGAGETRGNDLPAPDRLRSYSKALAQIDNGGPVKLGKQSHAWFQRNGEFDEETDKKRAAIYAVHVRRIMGEITMEACLRQVEEIVGQ